AAVEVSPKGFINLTLSDEWLAAAVRGQAADARLGRSRAAHPLGYVVDYSSPNVAKEMHAGHVRTTIIGDALCRLLADAGHRVTRENHIGDWGTPFGMLIEHLVDRGEQAGAAELSVGDLDTFYREARAAFDASEEFRARSRARVVALQSGDPETLRLWRILVDQSIAYFSTVYRRLGILLRSEDVVGESFYNDQLAGVVAELEAKGLLVDSEGAKCVFPPGFTNREGEPLPLIVVKSDGGYNYATTDLAALKDRFGRLGADVALYVVGAPQAQHFAMVFAVGAVAGWIPDGKQAIHVSFGSMLGADRKMFKTRAGDVVKLSDLVDEAVARATAAVAEKSPQLDGDEQASVARAVGVGALKYADLSTDRNRDYVFDWDRMLSFDGNTGPYLQYAHARIGSIFRRGGLDPRTFDAGQVAVSLAEPAERALAIELLGFDTAVAASLEAYAPHKLCAYLFDLAGQFTTFYETCPVLRAEDPEVRDSRLALCALTSRVLEAGLDLLGIEAPPRM
ncbi:MAG TPA: arginine--tRNA ligase, partial [Acidimicrobiales bacterium]|nr:arginine--tRNA ligase [Acidimicrobiales bacterium]